MKWCHRAVRDKLKQLCEVFGLPVLETPAAYSSRFCSRSGVPGFRAAEVTPGFTTKRSGLGWPGKRMSKAIQRRKRDGCSDLDPRTRRSARRIGARLDGEEAPRAMSQAHVYLRRWQAGRSLCQSWTRLQARLTFPAVVQADINAAINLALRAIADPRLWTIHPRLRSQREGGDKTGKAKKQKENKKHQIHPQKPDC